MWLTKIYLEAIGKCRCSILILFFYQYSWSCSLYAQHYIFCCRSPDSQKRVEKIDDLRLLFIHMHHLINEFRPHQARETLRKMLEIQKNQRLETADRFQKHLEKVIWVISFQWFQSVIWDVIELSHVLELYSESHDKWIPQWQTSRSWPVMGDHFLGIFLFNTVRFTSIDHLFQKTS